jgi:putative CocE/NonD family hydrolase
MGMELAPRAASPDWRDVSTREHLNRIKVPVFTVGGWYDNYVQSDLEAFATLQQRSGLNRIVIGPWSHNMWTPFETVHFGAGSAIDVRDLQIEWFDQWLMGKDSPLLSRPPVKIFVMGANRWREEQEWPPRQSVEKFFYLDGGGGLSENAPKSKTQDRYVFDPADPVPTRGGAVCCNPRVFPWGPMDQRPIESRKDVLVYTTRPLRQSVEAIGPVQAVLYVATSARDTDFTAKLVDVGPDGYARNLTDGILRLRYRRSLEKAELATPGEVYRVTIDAGVTGNVFLKGHRIRVEISSSNFPRFDRNPNTGGKVADAVRLEKASQTVYHDVVHPSAIVLRVMPGGA